MKCLADAGIALSTVRVLRNKSKAGRLERLPLSGRLVPEFPASGLREVIVGPYRLIYRYRETPRTVEVLTVWHGAAPAEDRAGEAIGR